MTTKYNIDDYVLIKGQIDEIKVDSNNNITYKIYIPNQIGTGTVPIFLKFKEDDIAMLFVDYSHIPSD